MRNWKELVRERIAHLRLQPTGEADLAEEVAQHLDDLYNDLLKGGASEEAAIAARWPSWTICTRCAGSWT